MFTDDDSIKSASELYAELKRYVGLQREYIRLELTEKLGLLLSALITVLTAVVLGLVALCYLSGMLICLLEPVVGSYTASFAWVAGVYALLLVGVVVFRRQLIIRPMVKFLCRLLLSKS